MSYHSVPNISETDHASDSQTLRDDYEKTLAPVESSTVLTGKRTRSLWLLVIPSLLVLGIIGVLVAMILWLINTKRQPFKAPESLTRGAIIVDEASRWCSLEKSVAGSGCDPNREPSLLGLTLSGLLVRILHFRVRNRI